VKKCIGERAERPRGLGAELEERPDAGNTVRNVDMGHEVDARKAGL
jgi:hypothetical protein